MFISSCITHSYISQMLQWFFFISYGLALVVCAYFNLRVCNSIKQHYRCITLLLSIHQYHELNKPESNEDWNFAVSVCFWCDLLFYFRGLCFLPPASSLPRTVAVAMQKRAVKQAGRWKLPSVKLLVTHLLLLDFDCRCTMYNFLRQLKAVASVAVIFNFDSS